MTDNRINNNINNEVAELRELKAMRDELEACIKAIENKIISFMVENDKSEYIGEDFKIKYSECTRTTLDKKDLNQTLANYQSMKRYQPTTD
ncbi:MAG: hypothetical protein UIM53_00545 [Acutalibacteraceae bacterium]|nr:hypothetical protein [Acutalibacteraceae bacterium]